MTVRPRLYVGRALAALLPAAALAEVLYEGRRSFIRRDHFLGA